MDTYLFRDYYSIDSFLEYTERIPLNLNSRTTTFQMYSSFSTLLDSSLFTISSEDNALPAYINFNDNIRYDGYRLDINKKEIVIEAKNSRGVRYAMEALNKMVVVKDNCYLLEIALIEDYPSFKYRGIIEGYYGEPWDVKQRSTLADYMAKLRLNTYMYAPKMDIYHRKKWYELYPKQEFENIKSLFNQLKEKDIDFYYCISPGHSEKKEEGFRFLGDTDYERLFKKLEQLIEMGVNKFGLLMDDIDYQLSEKDKLVFKRPVIAHAYLANKVNKYLHERLLNHNLVMCPTEYSQIGPTQYRNDLRELLDNDIYMFWTGDNVCAEVITEDDIKRTKDAFNCEIFIWDNFPVSDFTYGVREYIAPIKNRASTLGDYAQGYLINPSNQFYISQIGMTTMAHYAWNTAKYDYKKSFIIALNAVYQNLFEIGYEYFQYNYPNVLSYGNLQAERMLCKEGNNERILAYYKKVVESIKGLQKIDIPLIKQLQPWFKRALNEEKIVKKLLANNLEKQDLLDFLENIKFSGSELFDCLVKKHNILSDEEYKRLIKKRRGNPWYRVFEEKRWAKK